MSHGVAICYVMIIRGGDVEGVKEESWGGCITFHLRFYGSCSTSTLQNGLQRPFVVIGGGRRWDDASYCGHLDRRWWWWWRNWWRNSKDGIREQEGVLRQLLKEEKRVITDQHPKEKSLNCNSFGIWKEELLRSNVEGQRDVMLMSSLDRLLLVGKTLSLININNPW